jgi:FAD binding domain
VADVLTVVLFARAHNLLVAVRGGGHNVAGHTTCDGGIVIDLSPMKGIWVDPARRTVRAKRSYLGGAEDLLEYWSRNQWQRFLSPLLGERARVRGLSQALRGPSPQPSPTGRGSKTGKMDRCTRTSAPVADSAPALSRLA